MTTMQQPLVSIVIASYNRSSSLLKYSLPAIEKLTYPNYEVVIVDDCSTDDTQTLLKEYQETRENIHLFRNRKNRGAAFSRNFGVAQAQGDIIVLIDDDVSPFPDCLDELVKMYTQDSEVMAIWGCVYEQGGPWKKGTPTFGSGSLWSVRRIIFDRLRFDVNLRYFNTTACDEHEFARRIQKHGFKIIKTETAKANHFHAPAQNRNWRGIGGDLNFLYEKLKLGSLFEYYACLILSIPMALKRLFLKHEFDEFVSRHPYKQVFYTPHRIFVFMLQRRFVLAAKWLFYVLIDIPLRAKTKELVEALARTYSPKWPA
jgi:glycosyltransferase involved in cell wall biosynthesis